MKILDVPQSGSVGGVTSSRNRFGQYRRTRATPVNRSTEAQQNARTRLTAASRAWRGLSSLLRNAWDSFGATIIKSDSLGQSYTLTGLQAYIRCFSLADLVGAMQPTTPPAKPSVTSPHVSAMEDNTVISHATIPAGVEVAVYASLPQSAGVSFCKDLRFLGLVSPKAAGDFDATTLYQAKFGNQDNDAGNVYFWRFDQIEGCQLAVSTSFKSGWVAD